MKAKTIMMMDVGLHEIRSRPTYIFGSMLPTMLKNYLLTFGLLDNKLITWVDAVRTKAATKISLRVAQFVLFLCQRMNFRMSTLC